MRNKRNSDPLRLAQRRLWADDLGDIVRDLQRNQTRLVSENDVLDFLFSKRREDPETAALVKQVRKSIQRAVLLNQRIYRLKHKHRTEFEDAIYDAGEEEILAFEAGAFLEEKLITEH